MVAPVFSKVMVMSAQFVGRFAAPALGAMQAALAFVGVAAALFKFYRGLHAAYWIVRILRASAFEAEEQARLAVVRLRLCIGPNGVAGGRDAAIALLRDHGWRQLRIGLTLLVVTLAMSTVMNA